MKKLSVIIVNYNTRNLLEQCLSSIYDREHPFRLETIVVDNNSRDGSVDMVRKQFPNVYIIRSRENRGFARANNMGLRKAGGEYVLLLNSDTLVVGDALERMTGFLDSHEDTAIVSARVVCPDMSDQGVARMFPTPINALFGRRSLLTRIFPNNRFAKKYMVSRSHDAEEPFEVDWVSGACLMARKKVVQDAGFFDESFFMYWEDADLCYRIRKSGWKVFCVPGAQVVHYEGQSTSAKTSGRLIIEFNKSVYHYYRKHHIQRLYGIMNILAVFGLTARTLLLLSVNAFRTKAIQEGRK